MTYSTLEKTNKQIFKLTFDKVMIVALSKSVDKFINVSLEILWIFAKICLHNNCLSHNHILYNNLIFYSMYSVNFVITCLIYTQTALHSEFTCDQRQSLLHYEGIKSLSILKWLWRSLRQINNSVSCYFVTFEKK